MARNITLIQGTEAAIDVYQNDPDAVSATIYMKNDDTGETFNISGNYSDGVAVIEFDGNDTAVVGVYSYQVNENLSAGGIAKYGTFDCTDCEWGKIVICEALDGGIS